MDCVDPCSTVFDPSTSFATAKKDMPQQWKLQGDILKREKRWKQACLCYRNAKRFDLEARMQAMALESEHQLSKLLHLEVASYYLMADEILHNESLLLQAAKHLADGKLFSKAGWLYQALCKVCCHNCTVYTCNVVL